jgi:hypothetical protein
MQGSGELSWRLASLLCIRIVSILYVAGGLALVVGKFVARCLSFCVDGRLARHLLVSNEGRAEGGKLVELPEG